MNWAISPQKTIRQIAKVTLWLGIFLFFKVVIEDFVSGTAGLWSLDLSERVVREKTGSGLVVSTMILHLEASSEPKHPLPRREHEFSRYVEYGNPFCLFLLFHLPKVIFFFLIYSTLIRKLLWQEWQSW